MPVWQVRTTGDGVRTVKACGLRDMKLTVRAQLDSGGSTISREVVTIESSSNPRDSPVGTGATSAMVFSSPVTLGEIRDGIARRGTNTRLPEAGTMPFWKRMPPTAVDKGIGGGAADAVSFSSSGIQSRRRSVREEDIMILRIGDVTSSPWNPLC